MRGRIFLALLGALPLVALRCADKPVVPPHVAQARLRAAVHESETKVESLGVVRAVDLAAGSTQVAVALPREAAPRYTPPARPETVIVHDTTRKTDTLIRVDTFWRARAGSTRVASREERAARGDTSRPQVRSRTGWGLGLRGIDSGSRRTNDSLGITKRKRWCVAASIGYNVAPDDFGRVFFGPTIGRELVCF